MSDRDDQTSIAAKSERLAVFLVAIAAALAVALLAGLTVIYAPYLINDDPIETQFLPSEIM